MTSTLQQRVRHVARHARQLVRLYGAGWFVAIVCLAALAVGSADYLVRFEDLGIRLICFALLSLTAAWGFSRFVVLAWRYRCSELQAARHIERLYPDLGDRLTSAVAFASDAADDLAMGSVELRRAVVAETEAVTEEMDFAQCLDRRQPMRALVAAGISLAAIAVLALVDGPSVSLAAKRLLVPWGNHPWPRRHVLQWDSAPTRLAAGQDFEVKLSDANGQLPERVEIHYWFEDDDISRVQTFQMQPLGKHLVHRLASITRPFQYRAVGGDDQTMAWTELTVVEPPRITQREITLRPPAYTGVESRQVEGSFRSLVGTQVALRCRTSKSLSAAMLETDTVGGHATISLTLDEDRRGFSLDAAKTEWTILQSGVYGFRLVDKDGLDIGIPDQWDVHALRDLPPTVSLKRPAVDLMVTPQALVSLEAIVKDDLAVRSVELHFLGSTSVDQMESILELWTGPTHVVFESVRDALDDEGVQRTVRHIWDLTRLSAMKPGEWIDFRVTAEDYKSQIGESGSRRLTFISTEELEDRIAQRQSELLAEIAEIVRLQRETQSQTSGLEIQMREMGRLAQNDVDQLQSAELNQRQVQQRLGRSHDGVVAEILGLMNELRNNRVDNPDLMTRLRQLHDTIEQLNEGPLSSIQHQLIDAVKIVRERAREQQGDHTRVDEALRDELVGLFAQIGTGQQQVIDVLEQLLGQLAQWDSYQRLAREIGRLKREQERVYGRTQQLRIETLTKDPNDFTAQQRASLKRLTQRQNDVALQFGALTSGMEVAQQNLQQDDPLVAATLADALELIRDEGIGGLIRDAGRELDRLRMGQAVDRQEVVIELLEQLQDVLANRRQFQLDRRRQQLQDASSEIERIRERQQAVRDEMEESASATPEQFRRWSNEERELALQVERLSRQLQRQAGDVADIPLKSAGQSLRGAGESADAGDLQKTRDESKDAQGSLNDAQAEIDAALQQSEETQRDERITRIRQTIRDFLSRQQRLIEETQQADLQRQSGEVELRSQWEQIVKHLAIDQGALGLEVEEVGDTLSEVVTFSFALQSVADFMARAGQRLESLDTGVETIDGQRQAAQQLQQLLEAIMEDEPPSQPDDQQPKQQNAPDKDEQQNTAKYLLAQLRLIRAMQQQVNRDTELLEQAEEPWGDELVRQHRDLVQRQRHLAEIVLQLLATGVDQAKPVIDQPSNDDLDALDRALELDEGEDR